VSLQANSDPVHTAITRVINEHAVVLFMKGEPGAPECGFSATVVKIQDYLGIDFVGIDVLKHPAIRAGVKVFSDWPTVPQLYLRGEFVGGADIVREMFQSGELKTLLTERMLLDVGAKRMIRAPSFGSLTPKSTAKRNAPGPAPVRRLRAEKDINLPTSPRCIRRK
jgi:monothiol glutaredoxin